jgi:hypothetical protein
VSWEFLTTVVISTADVHRGDHHPDIEGQAYEDGFLAGLDISGEDFLPTG